MKLPLLLVCAGSIAIGVFVGVSRATSQAGSTSAQPTPTPQTAMNQPIAHPQPTAPLNSAIVPTSASVPSAQPAVPAPNLPAITISTCNGTPSDANFRSSPGGSVIGWIPAGAAAYLTGKVSGSWVEVQAPGAIADPGQPQAQTGWIAGCFVR